MPGDGGHPRAGRDGGPAAAQAAGSRLPSGRLFASRPRRAGRGASVADVGSPHGAGRAGSAIEYAYSGGTGRRRRTLGVMLWSDPENEPPAELRDMQRMLRRLGILMAVAMVATTLFVGWR